jgi:sec-independent protein translocase protein TatA
MVLAAPFIGLSAEILDTSSSDVDPIGPRARYPWSMPNIGPFELILVLVIALVVFGPKRLPQLGRQLGSGMREFKDSVTGDNKHDDDDEDDDRPAALTPPPAQPAQTASPEDTARAAGIPADGATGADEPVSRPGA